MRQLIYMEDDQGYDSTPHLFETDCPLEVKDLSELSYKVPRAGRFSTGYEDFERLVRMGGYQCNLIKEYHKITENRPDHCRNRSNDITYLGYSVVVGAHGNY